MRLAAFALLALFFVFAMLLGMVAFASAIANHARVDVLLETFGIWVATLVVGFGFLFSQVWLERLAARGHFKLVYYLGIGLLALASTAETYGAGCLFAYLALARRGKVTREELDWVNARLEKENRALGLFGVSFGLSLALEGKLAADSGDRDKARELRDRARVVFGTVTYLAKAAAPRMARMVASDCLALDAATRGEWGAVEAIAPGDAAPAAIAIRKWTRENLTKGAEPKSRAATKAMTLPIWATLSARRKSSIAVGSADDAHARMRQSYAALVRGQELGPRRLLNLLVSLDRFADLRSPDCRLPPEVKNDPEAAGAVAEELADGIVAAVKDRGLPVFALQAHGAVSARVYRALEAIVSEDLDQALKSGRERGERKIRGSPRDEWMEVSRIRGLYRRLEYTLGTSAAGGFAQQMFYSYNKLGVLFTATAPRRRPLAHAVFVVLRNEAARFGVKEAEDRETRNMRISSRID